MRYEDKKYEGMPTENRVYMPTGMDRQPIDANIMGSPYFVHGMKAE